MQSTSSSFPFIPIEGSLNFRDFGGYETENGSRIKTNLLFRCGMLADIPQHAFEDFSSLGIDVICDLRRDDEAEMSPTPLAAPFQGRRHIPIEPGTSHELRNSMMTAQHSAEERSEFMRIITSRNRHRMDRRLSLSHACSARNKRRVSHPLYGRQRSNGLWRCRYSAASWRFS